MSDLFDIHFCYAFRISMLFTHSPDKNKNACYHNGDKYFRQILFYKYYLICDFKSKQ